jgi:ABC-2 type transport system permease protein/oleandomycin transport system permease protein
MTTTTTTDAGTGDATTTRPAVSNRLPRGAAITDASVIAGRNLKDLIRTPQLIVFSVVQTVMFLLLFRYVFGGSIHIPGLTYVNFIVCGFMAQIAIFDGFAVAIAMAEDSKSGLIDRFRALPMARSAVVGGRAGADLLRQLGLVIIVIAVGFAIGFTVEGTWLGVVGAIGLCLVWGFAMFWVFAALGLFVRDSETAQAASTPFFILVFVSSSVILVDSLPGWLQPFARNQPLSQVCNAVRGLVQGDAGAALSPGSTGHYVITSLIWCLGITLVFAPLAVYAYRRP